MFHFLPIFQLYYSLATGIKNQPQLLPQCHDSISEPAGSAVSEESPPYCSGGGHIGKKTFLNLWCHHPIFPFLSAQIADRSAWWTEVVSALGEWRSLTRAPGAPSVITTGTWMMPAWCAGSWAVEKPSVPLSLLPLGRDQGPSGWMK